MFTRITYGAIGHPYNWSQFACDSVDDLDKLPKLKGKASCCAGSEAIIMNDGTTYKINHSGEWILYMSTINGNEVATDMDTVHSDVTAASEEVFNET